MKRTLLLSLFLVAVGSAASPQDEGLSAEEVIFLAEAGKGDTAIIRQIKNRRVHFELTPKVAALLRRKGVAARVMRAIREVRLVDRVLALKRGGKGQLEILGFVTGQGMAVDLSAAEALALRRGGLSIEVVRALQGDLRFEGFETAEHPGGFFRLQHPAGWQKHEEYWHDKLAVAFTPNRGRSAIKLLDVSVQIHVQVQGTDSPHGHLSLETINRNMLEARAKRKKETGDLFEIRQEGKRMRLQGVEAIRSDTAYSRRHGKKVRRWGTLLYYNGVEYLIACDAPLETFSRHQPVFEKILLSFNPAPADLGRRVRKRTANPRDVLEKYRESVVKVNTGWNVPGTGMVWFRGTGFFVRKDGYVLTNHHVVWLDFWNRTRVMRFPDRILIEWDGALKRKPLDVMLIDAVRSRYPHIDVALLKAKGANFKPLPLTRVFPPGKYVREQDQLLTLGFPSVVEMARRMPVTLTTTLGTLSKFNLMHDGSVDDIISDAVIHGGNSGGPMFDLETHSVIGLNTVTPVDRRAKTVRTYYSGVVPIDRAFHAFPEIIAYPESVGVKFTAENYVALAVQFLAQKLYSAALRQVALALKKSGTYALAYAVQGDIFAAMNFRRSARSAYTSALKLDPNEVRALLGLAALDESRALEHYTRALRIVPQDHRVWARRARLYLREGRTEDAERDAREAVKRCMNLYAEPFCLLASILYKKRRYDEGKRHYEFAAQIDAGNSEARFGIVEYYHVTHKTEEAARETEKVAEAGARDAGLLETAGNYFNKFAKQYKAAKDLRRANECWEKAFGYYDRAVILLKEQGGVPSRSMSLVYAWIAHRVKGDYRTAEQVYAGLTHRLIAINPRQRRVNDPELQAAYANLGHIFRTTRKPGLAEGFLQATIELGPDTSFGKRAKRQLAERRTPLRNEEIDHLIKGRFNVYAIADIVHASPLASPITQKEALALQRNGVHKVIIDAMLKASEGKVRDLKNILADWRKRDKDVIARAEQMDFGQRHKIFDDCYKQHGKGKFDLSVPGFKAIFYRCANDDRAISVIAAYNVACAYSLQKKKEEALDWLELAVYTGLFEDERDMVDHMQRDADLEFVRGEARYKAVIEVGRKMRLRRAAGATGLGIDLRSLSNQERRSLKLGAGVGVMVTKVAPGGPGDAAKLQVGDVISRLNDDDVGDSGKVMVWLQKHRPGTKISVTYLRKGEYYVVDVTLGAVAEEEPKKPGRRVVSVAPLGVEIRLLTPSERRSMKLGPGVGVMVTKVTPGGPAHAAKLEVGDVISGLNDDAVGAPAKIVAWLRKLRPGTKISVTYLRKGEYYVADVTLRGK